MRKKIIYFVSLIVFGWCVGAQALETKILAENETADVTVSADDYTRIAVEEDRIQNLKGPEGIYEYKNDVEQGVVILRLIHFDNPTPFTVFLTTEKNRHYVLRVTPQHKVIGTLLLKPKDAVKPKALHWEKTTPYVDALTQLMKDMVDNRIPEGYAVYTLDKSPVFKLGSQISATVTTVYSGAQIEGRIYCVKNRTVKPLIVFEREFYQAGDRAIALSQLMIPARGQVLLYKVSNHG